MVSNLDMAETNKEREDAAFQLILDALEKDRAERRKTRRLCVICAAVCVVALLLFGGLFGVLAAGIQIDTTTTTDEYDQSVEGDSAVINNGQFEQYNDNAVNGGGG